MLRCVHLGPDTQRRACSSCRHCSLVLRALCPLARCRRHSCPTQPRMRWSGSLAPPPASGRRRSMRPQQRPSGCARLTVPSAQAHSPLVQLQLLAAASRVLGQETWFNCVSLLTHGCQAPPDTPQGGAMDWGRALELRKRDLSQQLRWAPPNRAWAAAQPVNAGSAMPS